MGFLLKGKGPSLPVVSLSASLRSSTTFSKLVFTTSTSPQPAQMSAKLALHQHGKSRVRLGRAWVEGTTHHFVEWKVQSMLESDMEHAFLTESNKGMTATDTQKNTVYYIAKKCSKRCSAEEYAIALGKHLVKEYPLVSRAKVWVEEAPWKRISIEETPHKHGFSKAGTEIKTVYVSVAEGKGVESITTGVKDLTVLKTTQSGYAGFLKDQYTVLKDTSERIVATSITATWRYSGEMSSYQEYDRAYSDVKQMLMQNFFGPPDKGVYSPSVQYTLFEMAKGAIQKVPEVESIYMNLPNIHFIPCTPVTSKFENDVYIATSEPHGNIEAVVTRADALPHSKL